MPAPPLTWRRNGGADVHVLRSGPASRRLIDALDLGAGQTDHVTFIPNLLGSSSDHGLQFGVEVDPATGAARHTGVVTAGLHPNPAFPRVESFLPTAVFDDGAGHTVQSDIRIHVHDAVERDLADTAYAVDPSGRGRVPVHRPGAVQRQVRRRYYRVAWPLFSER